MLTLFSFIGCILAGAVITGNIFGDQRKQLGKKAVFYTWKGINVVRSYVIPSNPNSAGQVTQRTFFTAVVGYGSALLGSIIKTYWKLHAVGQSEFNAFVGWNLNNMTGLTDWANLSVSRGTLLQTPITSAVIAGTDLTISKPTTVGGNQLATDICVAVAYNTDVQKWFVNVDETAVRTDADIVVTIDAGLNPAKTYAWCFFIQRDVNNNLVRVSDSAYHTCV